VYETTDSLEEKGMLLNRRSCVRSCNVLTDRSNETTAETQGQGFSRRLFAGGLVAAAVAGVFNPFASVSAFAAPTSAEKQAEADEVKKKLDTWAAELDEASTKYYLAIEAHDAAVLAMEEAQLRIEAAESEVTRLQGKLGSRATSMYKQGKLSFLEVFFGAHSFSEFTSTWDLLNSLNSEDALMIESSKKARQDAQTARDDFAVQEQIAEQKLEEADEIKAKAEETVAAYETELANLEDEIKELIEKERKEEEERQAREAAAAAAAANGGYDGGWGDPNGNYDVGTYNSIIDAAVSRLGCPYVWGGNGPNVFDCSGLTKWCYAQVGISIGRVDTSQHDGAKWTGPISEAQPGDILWRYGHVGLFVSPGLYIHAPQTGDVVRYATNVGQFTCACRY
jgi:cell wall-associated NlpC family hydrolase